ncbi:L,D-transpeptidase family protein [Herbidospora sp. NEAU-GS84]|uniref:L,D-transpeptidase family protein n=1 Tax=Herbidospora solisilvae TaxID=2696284 RepID=A0A7C9J3K4_9ACTN|nr:L,D-transpeptidase family protein [Herbidospora solisilvae]NAS23746.1 L,D-transpeptidase family protein [Herbidospora solisilvae]
MRTYMVVGLGFGLALITGSAAFADSADRKHGNQAVKDRQHKHVQENKQHGRPTVHRDHTRDRRPVATRAHGTANRQPALGTAARHTVTGTTNQHAAWAAAHRHAAQSTHNQRAASAVVPRRAALGTAQQRAAHAALQQLAALSTAQQRAASAALQRHAARYTATRHTAAQHAALTAAQRRAANGVAQRRVAATTTAGRALTGAAVQRAAHGTTNGRTVLGHHHSEANHRRSMSPRRDPDGRRHMRFHYTDRPDAHDRHHDGHPRHHDMHGDRAHGRHHDMHDGRHRDTHGRHHNMDDRRHDVDTRHHDLDIRHHDMEARHHDMHGRHDMLDGRHHDTHGRHHDAHGRRHETHGRHHDAHARHHGHPNAHHGHHAGTHHAHQVGHQRHERQRPRRIEVMKFGDKSHQIRAMKQRLRELGFDSGVDDGRYGETTRYAVWAFQKVNGLRMTNRIDRDTMWALRHPRRVKPLVRPRATDRVEIDVRRQLLTVWRDGKPDLTTHISTGANRSYCDNGHCGFARTPVGDFRAGTRAPGWTTSPLGTMFNSIYFNGGIAMHGSSEVPKYPASHGCIRIPIHTSKIIYAMVQSGEPVYVRGAQSKYT